MDAAPVPVDAVVAVSPTAMEPAPAVLVLVPTEME